MTGDKSGVAFVDRLVPLLARGEVFEAHEMLLALDSDELRAAKAWFASSARWCREIYSTVDYVGEDHDARFAAYQDACWIISMCAVVLCGPRTAAERVEWAACWDFMEHDGEAAFVQLLWDQPTGWVAQFVDAASSVRLGGQVRNVNGNLSRVLRSAVVHHSLSCPPGATFIGAWLAGTPAVAYRGAPGIPLADWLVVDPLMPDLLWFYLAAGECGRTPELPEVIAELVRSGNLDRAKVLDVVLEQLTTNQRPASQRVLASILDALGVRGAEVEGGLAFLIGVLASGDRAVQPVLLPMALELAQSAEGWTAIADVVAGRPDKKAKETVLAALKKPEVLELAGPDAVASVLDVLGSVDDAAFVAKVALVRTKLGLGTPQNDVEAGAMGLWSLTPVSAHEGTQPMVVDRRQGHWGDVLGSPPHRMSDSIRRFMVDRALAEMAVGTFDGSDLLDVAGELLDRQALLCSAVIVVFEEWFLAGGLSRCWDLAVEIAERAAGAPVRPAGLANLVRLLVQYVPEVPSPSPLPPHLAALAAEPARTKAVMEARALAAALGDSEGSGSRAQPDAPGGPSRLGLWDRLGKHDRPLPSSVSFVDDPIRVRSETLTGLGELLSENFNGWSQSFTDVCWWPQSYQLGLGLTGLTEPDRVLAATVDSIHRHGADEVRARLRGIERAYGPVDVVAAIDAWAEGGLDVDTFWRLSAARVVSVGALRTQWLADGVGHTEVRERVEALPSFATRLRAPIDPEFHALVIPSEIESPLDRFAFLRAAEALIRADSDPVLLSVPTWADGTIDVEDLVVRLETVAQGSGIVGPVDLVQALHRLREVDARLVDRVPSGLRTDPRFTEPDGVIGWDASDVVKRWLALGGLPSLEPQVTNGNWDGAPVSPVPFTSLAAWPAELAGDPWNPGSMPATMRLHPRWPDRVFAVAFESWALFDPRHLPSLATGALGVPFHDRLLALLTTDHNQSSFQCSSTLTFLAQGGRIDPAAVRCAARGRHEAGNLRLSLLIKTFQREFDTALRGLWPMAMEIGDVLCTVGKRPTQLAELLRLLTSYAHEVPASAAIVPPAVLALAESKGTTKAHVAARELVGALRKAMAS